MVDDEKGEGPKLLFQSRSNYFSNSEVLRGILKKLSFSDRKGRSPKKSLIIDLVVGTIFPNLKSS